MKKFLAIFTGTDVATDRSGWKELSETVRRERTQAGIAAWREWVAVNSEHIAVVGGPIGATKRISSIGIENAVNDICGYVVVVAESHQAAANLFEGHPHFTIFPGEAVEVMECLPLPRAES